MTTRELVQAVIDGIRAGRILETFEEYYADDVVMSENGGTGRIGKAANREYEQAFVDGVELHAAEPGMVIVDGAHAAVEWTFDMTPAGSERITQRQVSLQTWKDGRIVFEVFYHP